MKILKRWLIVSVAGILIVFLSGFATQENAAAVINEDSGCSFFNEDWTNPIWIDMTKHSVTNHGGNTILICKAQGLEVTTGKVQKWYNFDCYDDNWNLTNDSYMIISADGNATLRCQFKKIKIK